MSATVLPNRRVLAVDDGEVNRRLMEAILTARGFTVDQACTGEEALELVAGQDYDVIVLDVMLPGIDGAAVCAKLKAAAPQQPVVLVTALPDRATRVRARAANADEFMSKPFDPVEFATRVDALARGKAERERDRAYQVRLEAELGVAREAIRRAERFATLGTLAAGVGHELKNLVMGIDLAIGMIDDDVAEVGGLRDDTREVLMAVRDRVLMHGRALMHLGRPAGEVQDVEVDAVVSGVIDILRRGGASSGLELGRVVRGVQVIARVDATQLEQVLINLLINASDAAREGGREVSVVVGSASGAVVVEVVDNGLGMAPETLARVFEPYFTTKESGTGLGLGVVRQIVQDWGGTLDIESEVGVGTTARFTIPGVPLA